MSEAEEYAKAVQSAANFGTKALDVSEKIGGFFAQVFKEPVQEVSGMITDKLRVIVQAASTITWFAGKREGAS